MAIMNILPQFPTTIKCEHCPWSQRQETRFKNATQLPSYKDDVWANLECAQTRQRGFTDLWQSTGRLDDNLLFLSGSLVPGADVDDAVGVDVERHLDLLPISFKLLPTVISAPTM